MAETTLYILALDKLALMVFGAKTNRQMNKSTFPDSNIDKALFAQTCIEKINDANTIDTQDSVVYFCCNWDVIHQVFDHVEDNDGTNENEGSEKNRFLKNVKRALQEKDAAGLPVDMMEKFGNFTDDISNQ